MKERMQNAMKKQILLSVAVAAAAFMFAARAETETANGYAWTYQLVNNGKSAEITSGAKYCPAIEPSDPEGAVSIPAKLGGKPVVSIGDYAFYECQNMTAVTIPATVTRIGRGAFEECISLEAITLPKGLKTIEEASFSGTSLRSIAIPSGVTIIGSKAFYKSWFLNVAIPDSVTAIGEKAFAESKWLQYVQFGKKVSYLGSDVFNGCTDLKALAFKGNPPADVHEHAFAGVFCKVYVPANSKTWPKDEPGKPAYWSSLRVVHADYLATVEASCVGGGAANGAGEYAVGKKAALKAVPDAGSVFCGWDWYNPHAEEYEFLSYSQSYSYAVTGEDAAFRAKFVRSDEDMLELDFKSSYLTASDGTFSLSLSSAKVVKTCSEPKLTFKGLPAGLKYDAKSMTISGKAAKPGMYKVTVSATNKTIAKAKTQDFTIVVPNYTDPLIDVADSYGPFVPGDEIVWPMDKEAAECDVTGLPSGMKWTKKAIAKPEAPAYSVYGAAAKPGYYTVYFTKTVKEGAKSVKHTATSTFIISDYPRLDITKAGNGKGSVTGDGVYAMHKKVPLKATPDADSVFEGWYESGWLLSQSASYSYEKGYFDETVEARFMTKNEDYEGISVQVHVPGYGDILNGSLEAMMTVPCGVYLEWSMVADSRSQSTVTVSGLPAGLKFTAKDIVNPRDKSSTLLANTIYGTPTAASKTDKYGSPVYSEVKIKVKTAGKTEKTYTISMFVDPMQSWAVGTFNGGDGDGLLATLTVASTGKISGKLTSFGATETLSANDFSTYDSTKYEYETSVTAKSGSFVGGYVLTITRLGNFLAVAQVHGYKDCYLYSAPWKAEPWKTLAKKFTTAAAKTLTYNALDAEGTPGMVTLQFAASGAVSVKGAFGNNSATGSTVVTPITDIYGADDEFDAYVYVELPFKANKFPGYSAKLWLHWNGTSFSIVK